MFNQITWGSYCAALLILLLIYYSYVLYFYYKYEITQLLSCKRKLFTATGLIKSPARLTLNPTNSETKRHDDADNIGKAIGENDAANLFPLVHELTHELQQAIQQAGKKAYKKEELIFSLQFLLKGYAELKETNFTEAINNLIVVECQNSCSISLNEAELKMLWV